MAVSFPLLFRAALTASGKQLQQISTAAKIPLSTASAMLNGTRPPRIEALEPLAKALGLDADQTLEFIISALEAHPGAPLVQIITNLRTAARRRSRKSS